MDLDNGQNILIGTCNATTRDVLLKVIIHNVVQYKFFLNTFIFLQFAIGAASREHYVLYITHTPFDYIPGGSTAVLLSSHRSSINKNIVFMYPQNYTELIDRLCSLHSWMRSPSIVVIDSLHAFGGPLTHPSEKDAQQIAIVIALLLDLASVFRVSGKCKTFLSVNRDSFKSDVLQKLVQTYYYTNQYLKTEGDNLLSELNKFI